MYEQRIQLSFFVTETFAKSIEETAEKYGMKRGEFIRWVLKGFISSESSRGF